MLCLVDLATVDFTQRMGSFSVFLTVWPCKFHSTFYKGRICLCGVIMVARQRRPRLFTLYSVVSNCNHTDLLGFSLIDILLP